MKRKWIVAIAPLILTACGDLASMVVEDQLQHGLEAGQKTVVNNKAVAKQREQLKREGKCPTCRGMGKTPDGLYTCDACKGTGKYVEK